MQRMMKQSVVGHNLAGQLPTQKKQSILQLRLRSRPLSILHTLRVENRQTQT